MQKISFSFWYLQEVAVDGGSFSRHSPGLGKVKIMSDQVCKCQGVALVLAKM